MTDELLRFELTVHIFLPPLYKILFYHPHTAVELAKHF
jgi:hypothetical protein